MPRVTIKTGIVAADGHEEILTAYLCDWPDCANLAEYVADMPAALRAPCLVCPEHAARAGTRAPHPEAD